MPHPSTTTPDTTAGPTPLDLTTPGFAVDARGVAHFRRHGFLVLRQVFTPALVAHLRELAGSRVAPPTDHYGSGFSRLRYDIGNDDPTILALMGDPRFADAVTRVTGMPVFFTQGLGFELARGTSTGFGWHVGTQSFGFQRLADSGFTIWVPLCEIDPHRQRGGMAYVSREHLSGEFVYQHVNLLPSYLRSRALTGQETTYDTFGSVKNVLLNSPEMHEVLDHHAMEDAFAPGDALIFDKYVLHRSVPLGEGPLPARLAYALRFSSTEARYDLARVRALAYPRDAFAYDVGSPFNEEVARVDGELVYRSPFFDATREARTLSPRGRS